MHADKFKFCRETVEFAGLKITPNGIAPTDKILTAIKDFPQPQNITDARSWFGLVNQVAWGYSLSSIMTPFRDLVKHNQTFTWNETLDKLFADSKQVIIEKIKEGIHMFDTAKPTCLQTDWSREGIGYLLLQKHCSCEPKDNPLCCPDGWKLVLAGSRFTSECESRYSPTEGEALAVTWALENARLFVLGCNNLIIITDHKPLLGIFKDRELSTISNPRLQSLKEKTLAYKFTISHCPGKWHRGPDAVSRNPVHLISNLQTQPTEKDLNFTYAIEHHHEQSIYESLDILNNQNGDSISSISNIDDPVITRTKLQEECQNDEPYQLLLQTIINGFPKIKNDLPSSIQPFWEVRHRLSLSNKMILMDGRIVIPGNLKKLILRALHSAHQGVDSMKRRANMSVYWPGLNNDIRNTRYTCHTCNEIAPRQQKEPLILTPPPQYPFQLICADYFEI